MSREEDKKSKKHSHSLEEALVQLKKMTPRVNKLGKRAAKTTAVKG